MGKGSGGRVSLSFSTFGGPIFWLLYFGLLLSGQLLSAFQTYWLGRWARAYNEADDWRKVSAVYYLGLYAALVVVGLVATGASAILYYIGAIKASRVIHKRLVDRIFGAYLRFLDTTPVGRIISRFTKDMKAIDSSFTDTFVNVADMTIGIALKFLVVVALVPLFSLPAIVSVGLIGRLGSQRVERSSVVTGRERLVQKERH